MYYTFDFYFSISCSNRLCMNVPINNPLLSKNSRKDEKKGKKILSFPFLFVSYCAYSKYYY